MGGFLGDVFSFEKFNLKEMLRKIKKDPERLFIGAVTPAGSKLWGGVTGKDYEPIVNQMGGASDDTYEKAKEKGIDTGPGRTMHSIAETIAAFYGGQGAAKGLGNAFGGGAEAASGAAKSPSWMDYAQMAPTSSGQKRTIGYGVCRNIDTETGECLDSIQGTSLDDVNKQLARYNSNQGPYNDGNTMKIVGDRLYWMDNNQRIIGTAPSRHASRALSLYEQDIGV